MNHLNPISIDKFFKVAQAETGHSAADHYDFFAAEINVMSRCAISPYCWLILDFCETKITHVSDSTAQFTPYPKKTWTDSGIELLIHLFHPDDRPYFLSAMSMSIFGDQNMSAFSEIKQVSIYGRMLNDKREYRWVLFRPVKLLTNKYLQVESLLAIVCDLSQFKSTQFPMLSIAEPGKEANLCFYKRAQPEYKSVGLPKVTNREKDILKLMAKGLTTPAISKELYISYYTVENHKRNLRKKTNAKTAAELLSYAITNGLLPL